MKVCILGLGVEGQSSALYWAKKGAQVTVRDYKEKIDPAVERLLKEYNITVVQGSQYLKHLDQFDMIVRTPGIKRNIPELIEAAQKGVVLTSQTQLFMEQCPCFVIGVTGTKGKGTTSSLIYAMLKAQNYDAYLGGNIGKPPLEFLNKLTPSSWVVLELSSYQLEDLTISPHIAVVLMITQEHLAPDKKDLPHQNYHESPAAYLDAKRSILRFQSKQDFAVVNRDYPASYESRHLTKGRVYHVSSTDQQLFPGCYIRNDKVVMQDKGDLQEIIDISQIQLPGRHNLENVCASVMAAHLAGVSKQAIASVLTSFKGLEHRLQLINEVRGVKYYDDSFSTTPDTAIAAIQAFKQSEVLILGGAIKGLDFSELGKTISRANNIKAIIGIGLEWPRIKSCIKDPKSKIAFIEGARDMKTIINEASKIAKAGDVVLLSPACSSFDMFKNYKDRGEQFKKEVDQLASKDRK